MSLMSGRSASGSVRSCGGGGGGGGSVRLGAAAPPPDRAASGPGSSPYDRKRDKKTVRVLTVIVYVFCVSLAAIMLSLYYVFFWEPKDAQHAQRKVSHTVEKQTSTTRMPTCFKPHTGRSNITVTDSTTQPTNVSGDIGSTQATEQGSGGLYTEPLPDPADLFASDPSDSVREDTSNTTNSVT